MIMEFILSSSRRKELTQLSFLFFFRWFTLSGMRAKGRAALCRTWSRTEQSLPCHTTSSSFTSNSKFPNKLQRDFGNGGTQQHVWVCMCVCVCGKDVEGRLKDSLAVALHLSEEKLLSKTASLKSNDLWWRETELILMPIWHFFLCWVTILEGGERSHDDGYVSDWMNQCLFS